MIRKGLSYTSGRFNFDERRGEKPDLMGTGMMLKLVNSTRIQYNFRPHYG